MSRRPLANSNVVVLPRVVPERNPYFHTHPSDGGYIPGKPPSSCWRCGGTTHVDGECGEQDCNTRENGPPLEDQPEDHMRAKVEHMSNWRSARED